MNEKRIIVMGLIFLLIFSSFIYICIGHDIKVETNALEKSRNIAYTLDYGFPGNIVSFDLASPGTFTILGPYTGFFVAGSTWANRSWYITDIYSGDLYIVNITNGSLTLIGGSGQVYNDISYDVTTGQMYGTSSYNLYKINIRTGVHTLVGSWGPSHLMVDIAIDNNGIIYGLDIVTDNIYIINKNTAQVSLLFPIYCAGNIEYDHDNNILYAYGNGALYTYNLKNGECIFIGYFQGNAEIEALAIPYIDSSPLIPTINGPTSGKPGKSYDYILNAIDPENNNIKYIIDWGDNSTDITDFNQSGIDVKVSHTWRYKGAYVIKVKAEDENGFVGPEATISVSIPRTRTIYNFNWYSFLERLPILQHLLNK